MLRNMLYLYYKNANTKILPEEIIGSYLFFLPMNTKEVLENDDLMHYIRSFNSCELCSNQMSKNIPRFVLIVTQTYMKTMK